MWKLQLGFPHSDNLWLLIYLVQFSTLVRHIRIYIFRNLVKTTVSLWLLFKLHHTLWAIKLEVVILCFILTQESYVRRQILTSKCLLSPVSTDLDSYGFFALQKHFLSITLAELFSFQIFANPLQIAFRLLVVASCQFGFLVSIDTWFESKLLQEAFVLDHSFLSILRKHDSAQLPSMLRLFWH